LSREDFLEQARLGFVVGFAMKFKSQTPSLFFRPSLLLLACATCIGQVHAAGDVAATSSYLTIQPNAANTHFVYTFSWVARDTDNAGGGAVAVSPVYEDTGRINPYGNGSAALDTVTNLGGGDYTFDNTANGGSALTKVRYLPSHLASYTNATYGNHVRYDDGGSNGVSTSGAPALDWVGYAAYRAGALAPGDPIPLTTATPKFDNIGNFLKNPINIVIVADGIQSVTGVFSTNPNGTGAVTGQGVGFALDHDGTDDANGADDFGPLLVGYDAALDPTPNNTYPNTGYVQVVVPYPTTGVVSDAFDESFYTGTFTRNAAVEVVVTTDSSYVPKIAVSGDFDSDGNVDADDLTAAAAGYGGAGVGTKWYANGNVDADNDTDNKDLGYVIGAFTPSISSGSATLTYDPATGNVKLDATTAAGAKITSFQLQNVAGTFVPGSYAGPAFGGTYQDVTASVIGNTDTTLTGSTGQVDLGNVFPTEMDLTALQAYLTTAVYTGQEGSGQQQLTLALASGGAPTYATWSGGAAVNADANGDGVDNGVAWALGATDADENAIGLMPTLDNTSDPTYVIFTFNRSDDAEADSSTAISVEYGSDLEDWTTAVHDGDDVIIEVTDASPKDTVVVKLKRSTLGAPGKIFARLNVVVTP